MGLHIDGVGIGIKFSPSFFFLNDSLGLHIKVFGHEVTWDPSLREFVLYRPDRSSWHWSRRHGRWTQKGEDTWDGWV